MGQQWLAAVTPQESSKRQLGSTPLARGEWLACTLPFPRLDANVPPSVCDKEKNLLPHWFTQLELQQSKLPSPLYSSSRALSQA